MHRIAGTFPPARRAAYAISMSHDQRSLVLRKDGGIHTVHGTIVPVTRVFELHGVPGMKANEKTYLR